jgi:hypothetical protein
MAEGWSGQTWLHDCLIGGLTRWEIHASSNEEVQLLGPTVNRLRRSPNVASFSGLEPSSLMARQQRFWDANTLAEIKRQVHEQTSMSQP